MQINQFLDNICQQIKYKPIRREISEELRNHIEEQKENYIKEGIDEDEAEEKAIKQMGEAVEIGRKLNKIHKPKLDWMLVLIIAVTLAFSFLATYNRATYSILNNKESAIVDNILFIILGLAISICIYFIDYRKLQRHSIILYIIATLSIIVAYSFGVRINGVSHLHLVVTVLPTVIAIPLYVIAFAGFIQESSKIKTIILSIISIWLIATYSIIPAFMTGLIYVIMGTVKLMKSEKRRKYITILWATAISVVLVTMICTESFRIERLLTDINPQRDAQGQGWQGLEQKTIIDSANLFEEADDMGNLIELFDGESSFALLSVLAHYGWIASILMIISILLLNIKLIINAIKIKDNYGKMLIIGISSIFILQTICNLLMNLNLGIKSTYFNMPLISYGGVNLIINMSCLALILSIYRRKDIMTKNENNINIVSNIIRILEKFA